MHKKYKTRDIILKEILLIVVSIIMIAPVILALTMSFQTPSEVFSFPPKFLPKSLYIGNFITAIKRVNMARLMWNSTIMAVVITLGKLFTGTLAGYAFSNFRFPGKNTLFMILFFTLFLPAEMVMIVPLFLMMKHLHWINTYLALTVPFLASATNTFLMRQHFLTIPKELEDAAIIDGAGPIQYLTKILLPLSLPMLGGAAIINFVYAWNMYLWPLIATTEDRMKTVQVGVKMLFISDAAKNWGVIMAGTVLVAIPTLVVFFLIQNLFIKSLVRSGMKG